jgi:hypothetical protein
LQDFPRLRWLHERLQLQNKTRELPIIDDGNIDVGKIASSRNLPVPESKP